MAKHYRIMTRPASGRPASPPMRIPHLDHLGQDRIPGLGLLELRVREHAAIPADVLDAAGGRVLQPIARAFYDIELAVGVISRAVLAGFVVGARSVDFTVVLRHV